MQQLCRYINFEISLSVYKNLSFNRHLYRIQLQDIQKEKICKRFVPFEKIIFFFIIILLNTNLKYYVAY